jgi:hypothetical protein
MFSNLPTRAWEGLVRTPESGRLGTTRDVTIGLLATGEEWCVPGRNLIAAGTEVVFAGLRRDLASQTVMDMLRTRKTNEPRKDSACRWRRKKRK